MKPGLLLAVVRHKRTYLWPHSCNDEIWFFCIQAVLFDELCCILVLITCTLTVGGFSALSFRWFCLFCMHCRCHSPSEFLSCSFRYLSQYE
jgi:hypothetical protein